MNYSQLPITTYHNIDLQSWHLTLIIIIIPYYVRITMHCSGYTGPVPTSATNFTNFFRALQCQLCTEDRPMAPATSTTVPAPNILPDYIYILLGVLGAILLIVCVLLASSVVVIIVLKRRLR